MRTNLVNRLRAVLRGHPDGLPIAALMDMTGNIHRESVQHALQKMPDAYVDRWEKLRFGYQAVWCVVVPPENCPHPARKVVAVRSGGGQAAGQPAPAASQDQS